MRRPPNKPQKLGVIRGDDEGDDGQIIEALVRSAPYRVLETPDCRHPHADVDERRRTVECRDCGVGLDPIEVLGGVARNYSQQVAAREGARREADRAREEEDAAKRDRDRMRARRNRERKHEVAELAWDADGQTIDLPLSIADLNRVAILIRPYKGLNEYRHLSSLISRAREIWPKANSAD